MQNWWMNISIQLYLMLGKNNYYVLYLFLISCEPGNDYKFEVCKTDSFGYVVKAGDYFKWSNITADTVKMKKDAEIYLLGLKRD